MSSQQPTYEELAKHVNDMKLQLAEHKTQLESFVAAKYKGEDKDKEHKEMEASFLKAQSDMENEDKDHKATHDDMEKVKDAFKKAKDEDDPEKKHEAMKKATDMMEEHKKDHKTSKKGEEDDNEHKDEKKDAKIAGLEDKFSTPLKLQILEATKAFDPTNFEKVANKMKTASLQEVEAHLETIRPFIAALGVGSTGTINHPIQPTMIPFQAGAVTGTSTDIKSASINDIDFSKVSTKDIMEMYK